MAEVDERCTKSHDAEKSKQACRLVLPPSELLEAVKALNKVQLLLFTC